MGSFIIEGVRSSSIFGNVQDQLVFGSFKLNELVREHIIEPVREHINESVREQIIFNIYLKYIYKNK